MKNKHLLKLLLLVVAFVFGLLLLIDSINNYQTTKEAIDAAGAIGMDKTVSTFTFQWVVGLVASIITMIMSLAGLVMSFVKKDSVVVGLGIGLSALIYPVALSLQSMGTISYVSEYNNNNLFLKDVDLSLQWVIVIMGLVAAGIYILGGVFRGKFRDFLMTVGGIVGLTVVILHLVDVAAEEMPALLLTSIIVAMVYQLAVSGFYLSNILLPEKKTKKKKGRK